MLVDNNQSLEQKDLSWTVNTMKFLMKIMLELVEYKCANSKITETGIRTTDQHYGGCYSFATGFDAMMNESRHRG